jgi:hypothetical protein
MIFIEFPRPDFVPAIEAGVVREFRELTRMKNGGTGLRPVVSGVAPETSSR